MTLTLAEAKRLRTIVHKSGKVFVLTHNYTGNSMVKQAKAFVRSGKLGTIRKVVVEYPQGWLSTNLEKTGQKQAVWRGSKEERGVQLPRRRRHTR